MHVGDHPCREMERKWLLEVSKFLERNVIILFHKQYAFIGAVDHELNSRRISHYVDKRIIVHQILHLPFFDNSDRILVTLLR